MSQIAFSSSRYRTIIERLRSEDSDLDERTLADTVEGLTDFHEIAAAVIRAALKDEALATGLKGLVVTMQARLDRLQDRAHKRREIARHAMVETEVKRIIAPDFTVSVRPGAPALVIVDETAIPPPFWEPRDPRLNRQALLAELKQGRVIDGVELSNPQAVLSVRTK
jgi:hypothetical protein